MVLAPVVRAIGREMKSENDKLRAELGEKVKALESTEHRLERHAQHLARLETRIQSLERK